jgi:hypothetical protein
MTPLASAPRPSLKSPVAYGVKKPTPTVVCREHLEILRLVSEPAPVKLTGETFPAERCAICKEVVLNRVDRAIHEVTVLVDDKLRGVQLPLLGPRPKHSYRVGTGYGCTQVLCNRHLDAYRATHGRDSAIMTGEFFAAELCDRCIEERGEEHLL